MNIGRIERMYKFPNFYVDDEVIATFALVTAQH